MNVVKKKRGEKEKRERKWGRGVQVMEKGLERKGKR